MLRISDDCAWNTGGEQGRGVHARRRVRARTRLSARRAESGAAAVEFALILPILVTLLAGLIQYGYYFYVAQTSSSGAREAARRIVVGDCRASGEAQTYARSQANLSSLTLIWGTPSGADGVTAYVAGSDPAIGSVVRVKVQANGKILGLLPLPDDGQVTRVVDTRNEDNTASGGCS